LIAKVTASAIVDWPSTVAMANDLVLADWALGRIELLRRPFGLLCHGPSPIGVIIRHRVAIPGEAAYPATRSNSCLSLLERRDYNTSREYQPSSTGRFDENGHSYLPLSGTKP